MKVPIRPVLAAASAAVLLFSCASSRGSTYSAGAGGDASAARSAAAEKASSGGGPGTSSDAGSTVVVVEAPRVPKGTVVFTGLPPDAAVYVDGALAFVPTDAFGEASISVEVGFRTVLVERFGYEPFRQSVLVAEGGWIRLEPVFAPVAFELEAIRASPVRFDPGAPGFLGTCAVELEASAPGRAAVDVLDPEGNLVASLGEVAFDSPSAALRWDGRGLDGKAVPPGTYLVRAEGRGDDGNASSARTRAAADPEARSPTSLLYSGVSGPLLAPDARVLPAGSVEAVAAGLGHASAAGADRWTVHSGVRIGLSDRDELDASALLVAYPGASFANSITATAAYKRALAGGRRAGAAVFAKASAATFLDEAASGSPPSWDGPTRYAGFSAGLPLEFSPDRAFRFVVVPELQASNFFPQYGEARPGSPEAPGVFAWGYLRAAVEATAGPVVLAASAALRTELLGYGPPGVRLPVALGFEARWHARNLPLFLAVAAAGEVADNSDYFFGAGLAAGLRF